MGPGSLLFVESLPLNPSIPTVPVVFIPGISNVIVSASREQSRIILGFMKNVTRSFPNHHEYRYTDTPAKCWCVHEPSGTEVRVLSSSGKTAMGLTNYKLIWADEPAAWETRGGALMFDALRTSLGKQPDQRLLIVGTRAPADSTSWWLKLLDAGTFDWNPCPASTSRPGR